MARCYLQKRKTDCAKFEIPDHATNFTTCKKLDDSECMRGHDDWPLIFFVNYRLRVYKN